MVCKTISKLKHAILATLYFASVENTDSWCARKGDLQHAFPLDILMVPSSSITITTDGVRLTYGGFSLDETILLGNFEIIANYFGCLSLSPRRGGSGTAFMGSTRCGVSSLW
jgi:hypothetical protein